MSSVEIDRIEIDEALTARLAALTGKGHTPSDLANDVLRSFVEKAEGAAKVDTAEDERRWQEYLRTGRAVSFDEIEAKLLRLEEDARSRMKHP